MDPPSRVHQPQVSETSMGASKALSGSLVATCARGSKTNRSEFDLQLLPE